jgi:exosortase/archaeosortase family protein
MRQNVPHLVALTGISVETAAWATGKMAKQGWESFGWATLKACRGSLSLLSTDTVCIPDQFVLGTSTFKIEIAPSCSGYEGIGLILVFLLAFFRFFRRELRFPQAFLLLSVGAALMWLANVGRITGLILVGTWISPAVALSGFHSRLGWFLFGGRNAK